MMDSEDRFMARLTCGLFVLVLGLTGGWWVVASLMEARAYERVTGKHVTTWDAMFLDLRVQEPVR